MPDKFIVAFPTKGSLLSIVNDNFDGIERKYPLNDKNKIVNTAILLKNKIDCDIFLETKYLFGYRDKRIELVLKDDKEIFIAKIVSDPSKIDKEALNLDTILLNVASNYQKELIGAILLSNSIKSSVLSNITGLLKNKIIFVDLPKLKDMKNKITLGDLNVIFNK